MFLQAKDQGMMIVLYTCRDKKSDGKWKQREQDLNQNSSFSDEVDSLSELKKSIVHWSAFQI